MRIDQGGSMKIGLISINAHTKVLNFASPLHTYAFQQFLAQNGLESEIIDYKPCYYGKFDVKHPYDFWLAHPMKNSQKQEETLEKWKLLYDDRAVRFDKFEDFIQTYYKKTNECYTQEDLDKTDLGYDIYMCVTDVIWKYNPKNGYDRGFFLACKSMENKGKIAYSTSKGVKEYTEEQGAYFKQLIDSFHYISCREKSLYNYINSKTKKKASLVLDPVFLQKRSFYENLAQRPKESGYVLIYAVMEVADQLVEEAMAFAKKRNLKVIDVSDDKTILYHSPNGERITKYDIGVEEWLGYMQKADYIFTNSFHCCCFSIIFNKQFYVGKRGGDKVDWLLELFDLKQRKFAYGKFVEQKDINFEPINNKVEEYVKVSSKWVLDAIHRTQKQLKNPILKKFQFRKLKGIDKRL